MNKFTYVVLDLETTGLSKYYHRIIEIAAKKYDDNDQLIGEFHTLVNPETEIPSFITRLTGITNDDVKESPTIEEALPKLIDFLEGSVLVAHNATFDKGFLEENAKRLGINFSCDAICTRRLASRILTEDEIPNKRLSTLCEYFNLTNENAHRAMADVSVTVEIFQRFKNLLYNKGFDNKENLIMFNKMSPTIARKMIRNTNQRSY